MARHPLQPTRFVVTNSVVPSPEVIHARSQHPITDRKQDFDGILLLLSDSYTLLSDVNTWSFSRFAGWTVYSAPKDLSRLLHLWRTEAGKLVGFAIIDGGRDTWVVTHPAYRDIERDIFTWVEQDWPAEGNLRVTYAEFADSHRRAVLTAQGYREGRESEYMHKYDLSKVSRTYALEPGFTIRDVATDGDHLGRAALTHEVFHPGEPLPENYRPRRHLVPSYDATLDLAAFSPEGKPVAFATGWLNPENGSAETEPVGTRADYRQRGLAKALVTEAFKRLADRGATYAHIASAPKPAVSNFLCDGLGPVSKLRFVRWIETM